MSKNISTVIQEMKQHRNSFMKKSTPYRQLNRAIKQLERLEQIEKIFANYDGSTPSMITQFSEIQKVLEQDN